MKTKNLVLVFITMGIVQSCHQISNQQPCSECNIYPKTNPYLSAPTYGVSHFNPAQNDVFPFEVAKGTFTVDLNTMPIIYSGPINIMTLASTDSNHMWAISTDRVTYVNYKNGKWEAVAQLALPGITQISTQGLKKLVETKYTSITEIEKIAKDVLGNTPQNVTLNGLYTVVDNDNNVYVNAGTKICVFGLKHKENPSKGIEVKRILETKEIFKAMSLMGLPSAVRLIGMNMTYDGDLIIGSYNGIAIIDREFKSKPIVYTIEEGQLISNSFCVDEKNGIYIVSGSLESKKDGIIRRLVWTGKEISDKENDGAWKSPYEGGNWPPAIKAGTGSGSTPTLMGFENNKDKLVVITDGADRMNIVAFWREEIPKDFKQIPGTKSRRIAGQFPITAGRPENQQWIQSEQSVVVMGWGAFVVNNVITNGLPDKVMDAMAIGPVITPPMGCQRLEWDYENHKWKSVWTRGDAISISTVPVASSKSNIVFINGYTQEKGWNITGLDWETGKTVTTINFGHNNLGNGAYAIEQFFPNGDLLFNSLVGTIRIPLKQ